MPELSLVGADLDGLSLHYVREGRGPATVLIHGLGGFAESWRGTIAALRGRGTVIALDLPGFGRSAKPRRDYRLSFHARAVEGLLCALGVERVRLVGHSLGGAVAVAHAVLFPDRVERLALLGATVPGFPLRASLAYRLMVLPGVGEIVSSLLTPSLCAAALARCFAAPEPDEIAFLVSHEYAARTSPAGRAAYLSTLRSVKADFTADAAACRRALGRLEVPSLIVHGRQDPVVPMSHAAAVARELPVAEGRWLDRCGHFPQIEHPATVNGWLADFLYAGTRSR
ncbi:MAG: alpha/beta fold hydrolase [Candidatus Rokubacteria bacterium]|nr:alpha/beta fold hydrolase [Candidatus Rokubacteria bacterium]